MLHCCGTPPQPRPALCTTGWLWHAWPLPARSWRSTLFMVYNEKCFWILLDVPRRAKSPPWRAICWRAPSWDAGGPEVFPEGYYTRPYWQMSLHSAEKILLSWDQRPLDSRPLSWGHPLLISTTSLSFWINQHPNKQWNEETIEKNSDSAKTWEVGWGRGQTYSAWITSKSQVSVAIAVYTWQQDGWMKSV